MATQKFIHTINNKPNDPYRLRATELINDDQDSSLINKGSETKPVYFKDGVPVECSNALAVNVSSADCVNHSITIGDKSYNGSSDITIEAKDLGLTGALVFLGVTTSLIADGVTTNPIKINGKDVTAITGNVVLYNHKEFVWTSSSWEELGDEGSYALKTITITAGEGLTGGGTLESNRTISLGESGVGAGKYGEQTSGTLAHGGAFVVPELTIDKYGRVTGASTKTLTLPTDNDTHYTANLITGASSTTKTNAAASTNGKVYLNLVENNAVRNSHNIVGSGSVTVTSDANGKITINGTDTKYALPSAGENLGGVKTGGDVTISDGTITVNDDSHNHIISNIDGLQSALNTKAYAADLATHTGSTTIHITSTERTNWNAAKTKADNALSASGGTISGELTVTGKLTQGSPSADTSVTSMNRFQTDLFVQGNGTAPNNPSIAGFYLGKCAIDENRHMDIVSGGDYSFIDFNKAGTGRDFEARILVNVSTGLTYFMWDSAMSENVFDVLGTLRQNGVNVSVEGHTHSVLDANAGSATQPVYFTGGKPTATTYSLGASVPSGAIFTDQKVKQTAYSTSANLPILTCTTASPTSGSTYGAYYDTGVYINHSTKTLTAKKVVGAVWNDYAEYRETKETIEPGRCVVETGHGDLILATERLAPGGNIVSDTFGFAIGETETNKTPLAVAGRVLAYTYEDRMFFKAGDAVCSGPNGTISLMTREEIREYPERIIGTVSEIPVYETWGEDNVPVNGRIWIKVR